MVAKKNDIIEYAKSLYIEVNEDGNRINTFQEISNKVQKKFKISKTYSTIAKWVVKYDWENTFIKLKQAGIEKGKEQLQEKENKLIDEKSQVIADIYKSNKQIHGLAKQTLLARLTGQALKDKDGNAIDSKIYNSDLIRLMEHAEDTLLNLHDKKKGDDAKGNIVINFTEVLDDEE
jgi:organic radical activating enzyme